MPIPDMRRRITKDHKYYNLAAFAKKEDIPIHRKNLKVEGFDSHFVRLGSNSFPFYGVYIRKKKEDENNESKKIEMSWLRFITF